jgi:NAD(P)-dependent dehydrogenase (short-subunit alcohol dehydrogenase family)
VIDPAPLKDRAALVISAAGGIGRAKAAALAAVRVSLALADRHAPWPSQDTELEVDVTSRDEAHAIVARTVEACGRLDIPVNVAGVVSTGATARVPEAEWDRVIAVNLKGSFPCCQAAIPTMRANRHGRIVNIGQIVGKNGGNARPWLDPAEQQKSGNVAYDVSKAGVRALTSLPGRERAADGSTVNEVAPGPVASAMTTTFPAPLRALIPVGRMAGAIAGEVFDVNGGMLGD